MVHRCFCFVQVKTLSEEATNRKALVESLKRRLNVSNAERSQYEASCTKLKEDLEKKVSCSHSYSLSCTFDSSVSVHSYTAVPYFTGSARADLIGSFGSWREGFSRTGKDSY